MDRIIYVYAGKYAANMAENYKITEFDMKDYRLVRVKVSAEFLRILQEKEPCREAAEEAGHMSGLQRLRRQLFLKWQEITGEEKRRRQQQLLEEARLRQAFLQEVVTDPDHSYFVCEESIPLLGKWSFNGYQEEEWVLHMMKYATQSHSHYVILGNVRCLPILLLCYLKGMKSLRWILPRRQFKEEQQELVEDIYEEYGLAVELHLLETESDYRRLRLVCPAPAVILDFSGEEHIPTADVCKESIWLDMQASELKRHRMEDRNTGIAYFSLKKEWKQPQKALYQLDTTSKNGYNTKVN